MPAWPERRQSSANMPDIALVYSPPNRARALTAAAALVAIIASVAGVP